MLKDDTHPCCYLAKDTKVVLPDTRLDSQEVCILVWSSVILITHGTTQNVSGNCRMLRKTHLTQERDRRVRNYSLVQQLKTKM